MRILNNERNNINYKYGGYINLMNEIFGIIQFLKLKNKQLR
jgi:hypothetical protein